MSKKYIILIAVFSLAGAVLSAELLRHHSDPSSHSFLVDTLCGQDAESGCNAVNRSKASVFLGLPVALWGLFFYTLVFGLAVISLVTPEKLLVQTTFLLSAAALVVDLALFVYSLAALQTVCTICILTYLATAGILVCSYLYLQQEGARLFPEFSGFERSRAPLALPLSFLGALVLVFGGMIHLAVQSKNVKSRAAASLPYMTYLSSAIDGFIKEYDQAIAFPLRQEHSPRKGPSAAILEITEFADFLCPACRRAGADLKEFFRAHPAEVAVTYRHYPLDMECNPAITQPMHVGACRLSYAAYCAQMQNRFWEMHDLIFSRQGELHQEMQNSANQKKALLKLASELSLNISRFSACIDSPQAKEAIARDVMEANQLNISGTPAIYIDGKKSGFPVGFLLEQLIEVKSARLSR